MQPIAGDIARLIALGQKHHAAGRSAEAERAYREALRVDPGHPEALHLLGILAGQAGQLTAARELFSRALLRDPENAELYQNLGETYRHLGDVGRALAAFKQALRLRPELFVAYRSGADTAKAGAMQAERKGRRETASELRRIAAFYLVEFASQLRQRGQFRKAEPLLREAAELAPAEGTVWGDLGIILYMQGRPTEAEPFLRRALALEPDTIDYSRALVASLLAQRRFDEGRTILAQMQQRDPASDPAPAEFLPMLYRDDLPMETIFRAHRDWGMRLVGERRAASFPNPRDPGRRLRVGYVSPDFKRHSVSSFVEPLLRCHDPAEVEVFCYSDVKRPDAITERLKGLAHQWRPVAGMADDEFRRQVRADGIDVLVELAGHTADNRLEALAEKPAPVTVTWLGYPATTGLPTMDYRLTDALADPLGDTDRYYTERLVRLPTCFLCYQPPPEASPVAPLPALAAGRVTFGSFNNLNKMTPRTIALWARLLQRVPGSRLVLKNSLLTDPVLRQRYADLFAAQGIGSDRLELRPAVDDRAAHLAAYHEIDIGLDTFPYHGTTTTCEALWMGVPTVSLIGEHHVSRVGLSLLANAGLGELAAPDEESYVRRAVALAADLPALARLRQELRERVAASPLCDGARFARDVEAALRQVWRRWCEAV